MKRLIFGSYTKIELRLSFKKILMMFLAMEMPSIYQIIWKQERKKRRIGFRKQERLEEEKKESIRSLWKWLWKGHENHGRKWKTTVGLFSRSISAASEGKKKERKFDRDFLSEMGKLFANNEISNKNADKNFLIQVIADLFLYCLRIVFLHKWLLILKCFLDFIQLLDEVKFLAGFRAHNF